MCATKENYSRCDLCGSLDNLTCVYDQNHNRISLCSSCLDDGDYMICNECNEFYDYDYMVRTAEDEYICQNCADSYYDVCFDCSQYTSYVTQVSYYNSIRDEYVDNCYVCDNCLQENYTKCDHCNKYISNNDIHHIIDVNDQNLHICNKCMHDMTHQIKSVVK